MPPGADCPTTTPIYTTAFFQILVLLIELAPKNLTEPLDSCVLQFLPFLSWTIQSAAHSASGEEPGRNRFLEGSLSTPPAINNKLPLDLWVVEGVRVGKELGCVKIMLPSPESPGQAYIPDYFIGGTEEGDFISFLKSLFWIFDKWLWTLQRCSLLWFH